MALHIAHPELLKLHCLWVFPNLKGICLCDKAICKNCIYQVESCDEPRRTTRGRIITKSQVHKSEDVLLVIIHQQ